MAFAEVLRNRQLRLFLLAVLIPSLLVGVLLIVVFRIENDRRQFRTRHRQDQIVRLFNNDLENLLQSARSHARPRLSLIIREKKILLDDLNIVFVDSFPLPAYPDSSALLLAAAAEERGDAESIKLAQKHYLEMTSMTAPLAPLARLALLRLALRGKDSSGVSHRLDEIRTQDENSVTASGIPVWVAATLLSRDADQECQADTDAYSFPPLYQTTAKNLLEAKWQLRASQWLLYSREILALLKSCALHLAPALHQLPDLIDQVERIGGLQEEILRMSSALKGTSKKALTWEYLEAMESLLVLQPSDPVEAFWLAKEDFLRLGKQRLLDLMAAEDFSGRLTFLEGPGAGPFTLPGLTSFGILFEDRGDGSWSGLLRRNAVAYATSALLLMALLGFSLTYRAVSREVEVARLKSNFVAAVSHEFRTPLTSIQALLERMESGRVTDPEMEQRYHKTIRREIGRLNTLVSQVLDFSRHKRGVREFDLTEEDLIEVSSQAVRSLQGPHAQQRVELQGDEGESLSVDIDRAAVTRCIHNLIENGLKYSPADSPVLVRVRRRQNEAIIEVLDRGLGVPKAERGMIFEEFFRGSLAAQHSVQGTGLGLALARHTIEQHGGRIELESQVGEGSCFRVVLPLSSKARTTEKAVG